MQRVVNTHHESGVSEAGRLQIRLADELVVENRKELFHLVECREDGVQEVDLSFERTRYVDSAGLGALVKIQKDLCNNGVKLKLSSVNEDLRDLFSLTKLTSFFEIE